MHRGLQETCDARVIYLDMNSFFASVEQQYHPELRDRPLAVVSHDARNGTVLAASYEAKQCGIRTGTKVFMARELCPSLHIVEPSPSIYRITHEQFMDILRNLCGPEVMARSIDEAAIFLSPNWYGSDKATKLALQIKDEFRKKLGLFIRCSIGIAPNSLLGKVASNLHKPDGLTEITLSNLEKTLGKLELTDLPGIASRNAALLGLHEIFTPLDFYHTPALTLQKEFGIWGRYWWWRLHGYEVDSSSNFAKTISHEHVLKHWVHNWEAANPIVARMADRLIHRLRRNHFKCRSTWIYIRLDQAAPLSAEIHFDCATNNYLQLLTTIQGLVQQFPSQLPGAIRKISIGFQGLMEEESGLQLDIFETRERQEDLSQAIESIRDRFGFHSLQLGNVMSLPKKVAQEQLGFGRIKDRIGTGSGYFER